MKKNDRKKEPAQENHRAAILLKLLEDLPDNVMVTKNPASKLPTLTDDALDGPSYLEWLKELDKVLRPSQEDPAYDFKTLPAPPAYTPPKSGPVWEVSFYDEFGEFFEETYVLLSESRDLVKALILAKNRLRSKR